MEAAIVLVSDQVESRNSRIGIHSIHQTSAWISSETSCIKSQLLPSVIAVTV